MLYHGEWIVPHLIRYRHRYYIHESERASATSGEEFMVHDPQNLMFLFLFFLPPIPRCPILLRQPFFLINTEGIKAFYSSVIYFKHHN